MKSYVAARAQLVTFILFVITIYFIEKFLESKKKRYAVGLIIIPILIANLHSAVWPFYFVLFLPYIGEYIVSLFGNANYMRIIKIKFLKLKSKKKNLSEEKLKNIQARIAALEAEIIIQKENTNKRREKSYKIIIEKNDNVKALILIMIICAFTGLLTPLGDTPYTYLLKTVEGNTMDNINEHLPLTLINSKDFLCLIIVFLAILLFTDTKIKLRDLFMIGGLLLLALSSRRQISMFVLIGSVILTRLVTALFDKYDPTGFDKLKNFILKAEGVIITAGIILIISIYMFKPKVNNQYISESSYPVAASNYILENVDVENMRIYNEYNYGSYLLFRGIPVFIDSRADLYAPEFNGEKDIFSDFINISNISVYYENKFKEYEITHVLVYKNAKLNMFLSRNSDYKLLYNDDYFYFYERLASND